MNRTPPISFLVDEDLSPELAKVAAARGYLAFSVTNMRKLRGRGDAVVARAALAQDRILVTRNTADYERIYQKHDIHPGLIFFAVSHGKLNKLHYQRVMLEMSIDVIEQDGEPIQQALYVSATGLTKGVKIKIDRFYLPDVA